ncbi:cysteine-rich protein 1-like isoform X3 [Diaphorina citri]|uniref:Cysteine-rich protein 1-like isoform X1 n=1 Tax=Diaphorina citri TaxID=121845 RepID=A0A3Q0J5C5_DIACI|nr:cysteine-rich protein 1-like isoform X1 [Diaphorina citri]XP_026682147.1 cysteine-rich protein 1-like isoform X2 [Diaphorina citri]XP_026682148.1 cysteine-rich protein 1-like isoform X3 [Diaphorina citri]
MPNCPKCNKPVYFAERKTSLGKDWHGSCLRCENCNKTLVPGSHSEHDGKPYCNYPCYSALFGPGGKCPVRSLSPTLPYLYNCRLVSLVGSASAL